MFLSDIEFEKKIISQTTGYIRFGGASYSLPEVNSGIVTAEVTHVSFGGRVNFNSIILGIGFEHSFLELYDGPTNQTASGSFSGPTLEIGKEFYFNPIITTLSLGAQLAKINYSYNATQFDTGGLDTGQSILTKLEFSIGYLF